MTFQDPHTVHEERKKQVSAGRLGKQGDLPSGMFKGDCLNTDETLTPLYLRGSTEQAAPTGTCCSFVTDPHRHLVLGWQTAAPCEQRCAVNRGRGI